MEQILQPEATDAEQHQTPPCPHFGPCGGCQLQNLTYEAQLQHKADHLRELFEAANVAIPELKLHASPPLAYRNRIRLTLGMVQGELRAGYMLSSVTGSIETVALDSHDPLDDSRGNELPPQLAHAAFLPITQCPIAAPLLWSATEAFLAEVNQRSSAWFEKAPFTFDQLELFTTADESALQLSLFVRTSAKSLPTRFAAEFAALCGALRVRIPQLAGAGMYLLPPRSGRSRRAEQPRPGPIWGTPGLKYAVTHNGESLLYWVPRGSFFQVNRYLLPELVDTVAAGRSGHMAWDLYAGVGLFTRVLATRFDRVTAVEVATTSFTALASAKLPNRYAVQDTTVDFLRGAVVQRDRPDLIVLDPPRTGAGREVCKLLGRIAAQTIVYISCSPHTLPGDVATLQAAGYTLTDLHLFDLFPQTAHIESVAILQR
jgi:23S rRNA (uracil1939-C5)-methyltransferase